MTTPRELADRLSGIGCETTEAADIKAQAVAMLRTLADQQERWQPIETAPHHEWLLLDCGNAGIVEGCYSTFEKEDGPRWFDSYGRTIFGPIHWMPLPDTPDAARAQEPKT